MKHLKIHLLSFASLMLVFASCSSDDDNQPAPIPADYEKGVLITNEGPFNNGTGTISYISDDFATVEHKIYQKVNGSDLGNVVQSMGFADNEAYVVVSNSQKIVIVDRYTFIKKDSIMSGFENPRYFASNGETKGYITDWGDPFSDADDFVSVIDLATNTISSKIPVSYGPDKLLRHGNKIYVAHPGGYDHNNLISVISGNVVEKTIVVGYVPNSMAVVGDFLYVMGAGKPDYSGSETPGTISKIDLATDQVVEIYDFDNITDHPLGLIADGTQLYYNLNGKVYKVDSNSVSLPGTPIIDGFFYAMEARDGMLYATDAGDFASRGSLLVYELSTGQQVQDSQVGIIPGGIYFNN